MSCDESANNVSILMYNQPRLQRFDNTFRPPKKGHHDKRGRVGGGCNSSDSDGREVGDAGGGLEGWVLVVIVEAVAVVKDGGIGGCA